MFKSSLTISSDSVCVVVTQSAKQPGDRTNEGADRQAYNSAYRQCWAHLMSTPSQEFDVELSGRASSPSTEVIIKRSLLEKIPLIHDIASNTSAQASPDDDKVVRNGQETEIMLPCSVWGLVSLLMLMEGGVLVKQWFETNWQANDPSLPAQTLQVAEFLGCKEMKNSILEWLQQIVMYVILEGKQEAGAASKRSDSMQSWMRTWHFIQVLRSLHDTHAHALFTGMLSILGPTSCIEAVELPQDLLSKWLAAQSPVVDLQGAKLSHMQWAHMAKSISEAPLDTITDLHIAAGATDCKGRQAAPDIVGMGESQACTSAEIILRMQAFCSRSQPSSLTCRTCKLQGRYGLETHTFQSRPSVLSLGFQCKKGSCDGVAHPRAAPLLTIHIPAGKVARDNGTIEQLLSFPATTPVSAICNICGICCTGFPSLVIVGGECTMCNGFEAWPNAPSCSVSLMKTHSAPSSTSPACQYGDVDQILSPLEGAVAQMTCLSSLGVHNLPLSVDDIRSLGHVLHNLPQCVKVLTLSTQVDGVCELPVPDKVLLFKAIALVRSLEKLCMPQWAAVVGQDATACTEPLRTLPKLVSIVVDSTRADLANDLTVYPAGFHFELST